MNANEILITFRAPKYMESELMKLRGQLYAQHQAEKAMAALAAMPQDELGPMAASQVEDDAYANYGSKLPHPQP